MFLDMRRHVYIYIIYQIYSLSNVSLYVSTCLYNPYIEWYIYIYTYNIYIYVHTQVSTWSLYFYLCSISYPQLRQARSEFTSQNVASDVTWLVGGGESEPKWALAPWFYVVYTVYNIHMIIYIYRYIIHVSIHPSKTAILVGGIPTPLKNMSQLGW